MVWGGCKWRGRELSLLCGGCWKGSFLGPTTAVLHGAGAQRSDSKGWAVLCCEGTWAGSALVLGVSQFVPEVRVRGVWWLWACPWATLWGRWVAGQGGAQECGVGLGAGQPWALAMPPLAGQGGSSSSGLASAHPQDAGEGQSRAVLGISSSSGA